MANYANFHVISGADATPARPIVRRIGPADLKDALAKGLDDFLAMPSHLLFLGVIYPIFGVSLAALMFSSNAFPLLFPLVSGFALIGPFAAIGLYEVSRRRERGLETTWMHALNVLRSPAIPSILALGVLLMAVFLCWLIAAQFLYEALFGRMTPESYARFLSEVFTTSRGWTLIILGHLIGFVFAAVVFSISVVSFPLLLDRDVGAATALETSLRAVLKNPVPMALWGLTVAVLLMIGSAPLLVGLAVVMPVLGHSTWHLYRKVVQHEGVAADSSTPAKGSSESDWTRPEGAPSPYPAQEQGAVRTADRTTSFHPLIESGRVQGTAVYDRDGKPIGTVERMVIEKVSGRVAYVVISFGGFFALGENTHAIPWGTLKYDKGLGGYRTNITEEQVRGAPGFYREPNYDWSDRDRERELHDHYGVKYYWDS